MDLDAWYLVPESEPEPSIATCWQCSELGKHVAPDNILTDLPLDRLHSRSTVYVLARKPVKGKYNGFLRPWNPITGEHDGAKLSTPVPHEELMLDLKVYGPIRVADHWSRGSGRFNSRLDRSSFLDALGQLASPWAFGWRDVTRKDGELPMTLYLRSA